MNRLLVGLLALLLLALLVAPERADAQGLLGRARRAVDRAAGAAVRDATASITGDASAADEPSPGALVLFATDFSSDAPGDFPGGFSPGSGTFAVVDVRGRRALRASSFGEIHVELPDDLPEAFTLDFEMAAPMGWTQEVHFQTAAPTVVTLAPDRGGLSGRSRAASQPAANPGGGRFFPVRIVADGARVRVFHSRTLIANVPEADLGRSNRLTFKTSASQADPVLIANVRLTTEAPLHGDGNPNHPGGAGAGRFEARAEGAVRVALGGAATFQRQYDGAQDHHVHTVTLVSAADPDHTVVLHFPTPSVGTGTFGAFGEARVGVGGTERTFRGAGQVALDANAGGVLRGRFRFDGEADGGETATVAGTFDAREPLAEGPAPSASAPTAADLARVADAVAAREGARPVVQALQPGTVTFGEMAHGDHPNGRGGFADVYAFRVAAPTTLVAAVQMFDVEHHASVTIYDAALRTVVESWTRENGDAETLPTRLEPGLYVLRAEVTRLGQTYNLYLYDPATPLPLP